ncbi:hypothetical protein H9P43_007127 [Blastocladiella emersonii ATCC 22665]|nr:hypothetical protein H9P43_007127 [Blastocladiella emersonii ATCC 22665]
MRSNLIAYLEQCKIDSRAPVRSNTRPETTRPVDPSDFPSIIVMALRRLLDSVPAVLHTSDAPFTQKRVEQVKALVNRQIREVAVADRVPLFTTNPVASIVQLLVHVSCLGHAHVLRFVLMHTAQHAHAIFGVYLPLFTWARASAMSINKQWEDHLPLNPDCNFPVRLTVYLALAALSRWDADSFELLTETEFAFDRPRVVEILRNEFFITLALSDLPGLEQVRPDKVIRILDWLIENTWCEGGRTFDGVSLQGYLILAPHLSAVLDHVENHPKLRRRPKFKKRAARPAPPASVADRPAPSPSLEQVPTLATAPASSRGTTARSDSDIDVSSLMAALPGLRGMFN